MGGDTHLRDQVLDAQAEAMGTTVDDLRSQVINSISVAAGLTSDVELTVTKLHTGSTDQGNSTYRISGTYQRNGESHTVDESTWMAAADAPRAGDVVQVSIGPLWWNPVIETTGVGVVLAFLGAGLLLGGALVTKFAFALTVKPAVESSGAPTRSASDSDGAAAADTR